MPTSTDTVSISDSHQSHPESRPYSGLELRSRKRIHERDAGGPSKRTRHNPPTSEEETKRFEGTTIGKGKPLYSKTLSSSLGSQPDPGHSQDEAVDPHIGHEPGLLDVVTTEGRVPTKYDFGSSLQSLMLAPLEFSAERLLETLAQLPENQFVDLSQEVQNGPETSHWVFSLSGLKSLMQLFTTARHFASVTDIERFPNEQRNSLRKANLALAVSALFSMDEELQNGCLDVAVTDIYPRFDNDSWDSWQQEFFLDMRKELCLRPNGDRRNMLTTLKAMIPSSEADLQPWQKSHTDGYTSFDSCKTLRDACENKTQDNFLRLRGERQDFLRSLHRILTIKLAPLLDKFKYRTEPQEDDFDEEDFFGRARLAASAALQDSNGQVGKSAQNDYLPDGSPTGKVSSREAGSDLTPKSTHELYQNARVAALRTSEKKTSPSQASSSQRTPWNNEEESALIAGLDRVNGPYWSQILTLYGEGGIVSEVLKGRNQVQLKDKARNIKKAFLRIGAPVPDCLKHVTGELKPSSAKARKASKETNGPHSASNETLSALAGAGGPHPRRRKHYKSTAIGKEGDSAETSEDSAAVGATDQQDPARCNPESMELDLEDTQRRHNDTDVEMVRAISLALQAKKQLDE